MAPASSSIIISRFWRRPDPPTSAQTAQKACPMNQYRPTGSSSCKACPEPKHGKFTNRQGPGLNCEMKREKIVTGCYWDGKRDSKGRLCSGNRGSGGNRCALNECKDKNYTHGVNPRNRSDCQGGWTYDSECYDDRKFYTHKENPTASKASAPPSFTKIEHNRLP